jgi:hypothetical protein
VAAHGAQRAALEAVSPGILSFLDICGFEGVRARFSVLSGPGLKGMAKNVV